MKEYQRNHYIPEWFQRHFLLKDGQEKKFFYLDLNPDVVSLKKHKYIRNAMLHWGPPSCFCQDDLYTTKFGNWESTEIEEKFFGIVDSVAPAAVKYFADFQHPSISESAFQNLVSYMSIQKL